MTSIALYQALLEANVHEDLAKKAVEENDGVIRLLDRVEVKANMMQWMIGFVVVLQIATIGILLNSI